MDCVIYESFRAFEKDVDGKSIKEMDCLYMCANKKGKGEFKAMDPSLLLAAVLDPLAVCR